MLGIEGYASDNDDDSSSNNGSDNEQRNLSTSSFISELPPLSKSSTPLPPSTSSVTKPQKKKVILGLHDIDNTIEESGERPVTKKPRLGSGAGVSSLLSMLPAPKQKSSVLLAPERVLGGGGGQPFAFSISRSSAPIATAGLEDNQSGQPPNDNSALTAPSTLFRPASIGQRRANISVEENSSMSTTTAPKTPANPPADFFSLGSSSSHSASSSTGLKSSLTTVSSAPKIEDFVPPEPTPTDEYPGYYRLPSGAWAAHDPAYYRKFYNKWQTDYNNHVRALEKGLVKGFEDLDSTGAQDVNAAEVMAKAKVEIKEMEERKAVTQDAEGGLKAPRMNIQGAKLGNRARSRHQLTTLLTEAYQNREALEEKIAEGRRNRKEAGNKYGF